MKKVSLLTCLLAVSLCGSAQLKNVKQLAATPKSKTINTVNIGSRQQQSILTAKKADAAMRTQLVNEAPRRGVATGVYYNRPSGSYMLGWTKEWGGWSADMFFGVPVGDNIVENACLEPEKATWSIITSTQTIDLEGEEGTNNLNLNGYKYDASTDSYDNGFNTFYPPTISVGRESYTFGEANENGGAYAVAGRPSPMAKAKIAAAYTGWSDGGYIYGTNAEDISYDFDGDKVAEHYRMDGIWQIHEAPHSPLYVEDIVILGRMGFDKADQDVDVPATIPEGTEVHLLVTKVDRSSGNAWPSNEVIADLTCSASDIIPIANSAGEVVAYSFVFAQKEIDIIGNESVAPFVLSDEYALILDWNIDGANLNIAGNDFAREDDDLYARQPSYMILTDDNGDTQYTTLSYNGVTCTPVFTAMFDYAKVYDVLYNNNTGEEYTDMNVLTAPVEGGKMWEIDNQFAYCQTALPWMDADENENYFLDNIPDWITDAVIDEDTEGENASGFTFISFEVEPLPAGVKGRKAEIVIQGKGYTSDPIIVVQGEVDDDQEEETVPADFTAKVGTGTSNWKKFDGTDAGLCATQFAPAITTADGRTVQLVESYETTVETVGDILTQTIEGLENGNYTVTLVGNAFFTPGRNFDSDVEEGATDVAYVYANDQKAYITAHIATETSQNGEFTLNVNVTDGTLKLGYAKDKAGTNWHTIQIKALTLQVPLSQAWETLSAEAQALVDQDMEATVLEALEAALTAGKSVDNYNALAAAVAAAKASVNAYANAATVLAAMKTLVDATNVYTQEAYDEYYGTPAAKYEAKTLTAAEGAALQNPDVVTGWHAATTVDNFLLSAWDTNPDFVDAPYYINTWSVEGDTDGSNFRVPFFEYWTGDAESLGERTLTATLNGLENGEYEVTSWTRVRTKNNTGAYTSGEGIFLQVNDGNPTDASKGDSKYEQGADNNFFVGNVAAKGNVTDGTLNIKYVINADNNISWLSFKNVFYKRIGDVNGINTVNAAAEQNSQMFNLQGQKVEKAGKGLYIINGKKVVK